MIETLNRFASRLRHSRVLRLVEPAFRRVDPLWNAALGVVSGARGYETRVNGERFRLEYRVGARYDRADAGDYEALFYRSVMDAIRPGHCVFDVGAHIGIFTLGAARRVGVEGQVHAFEAAPQTATTLGRHVAYNAMQQVVRVVGAAVADTNGTLEFFTNGESMAASLGRENVELLNPERPPAALAVRVRAVRLDTYAAEARVRPDIIKIDVEGAEGLVLAGAREVLADAAPLIFCEVHPRQMRYCGTSLEAFERVVAEAGYAMERLDQPNPIGIFHCVLRPPVLRHQSCGG